MAEFSFNCPFCNLELSIDESGIGQEIECPNCKDVLIIPAPSGGPAAVEEERGRGNVEPRRRDDQFYWSFNGEFWNDELGDYVFGLESECHG